jgi:hypothetical protein
MSAKPPRRGKGKPKAEKSAPEPAQAPGATGRTLEGSRIVEQPHGGAVMQHPPGSNGDVHRGPDRQLRINVVRGILLEALAKEGIRLVITPAGRRRRHRSKIPMALVANLVTRIQEIAFSGSDGDVLRLVFGIHEVFQPGRHEKNGDTPRPRPATFVVARPAPSTEESSQPPTHPMAPGTFVGANGQVYVE